MSHADVKWNPVNEKWEVIWHGNYGNTDVVARRKTKTDAVKKAKGKVTQALRQGWSDGTVHIYNKEGDLQRKAQVEYNA